MTRYAAYGRCLESSIEFPELEPAPGIEPTWHFRAVAGLTPMREASELGAERIYDEVHARLHAHADGHRISVDDTGSFDLSVDRRIIAWEERADAFPDFVRAHLLGRVLATAMHLDGWLPLHGSAVRLRDGVVGFLAPKGFGKSTLALALAQAGGRLVTDDLLPVEPAARAVAWPGVHNLRLRADSAATMELAGARLPTREGKMILSGLPAERLQREPAPLAALYLLDPALPADAATAAERATLPPTPAALSLVAHVKVGRMLGAAAAPDMLQRAAALARSVPVLRLSTARSLDRLAEVAEALLAWHGGAP